MKTRFEKTTGRASRVAMGFMLAALAGWPALTQISSGFKGSGWKYPERYELPLLAKGQTNRLKGMLMGKEGQHLSNRIFRVTTMQLEHYELDGKTNLVARAPECLFDMEPRIAWSTGRLEIIAMGGAMRVEGNQGFQVQMTNSVLTISNRVRTVIERDQFGRFRP